MPGAIEGSTEAIDYTPFKAPTGTKCATRRPGVQPSRKAADIHTMKIVIAIAFLLAVIGFAWYPRFGGTDPRNIHGAPVKRSHAHADFDDLGGPDFDAKDLAELGSFTVVDFYSESCAPCRALQPALALLAAKRKDLQVVRVDLPTQTGGTFSSMEEAQQEIDEMKETLDAIGLCGTPHVIILDPKGETSAADSCNSKAGRELLDKWFAQEGITY